MGYSMTVTCESKQALAQTKTFLDSHFRSWSELVGWDEKHYDPTRVVVVGNRIAYGAGNRKIGFNYSTSMTTGHYMLTVLRFLALRIGRKRTFRNYGLTGTHCYTCYDSEAWPVLHGLAVVPPQARWCVVDADGFQPEPRPWASWHNSDDSETLTLIERCEPEHAHRDGIIRTEIDRLAQIWETTHAN